MADHLHEWEPFRVFMDLAGIVDRDTPGRHHPARRIGNRLFDASFMSMVTRPLPLPFVRVSPSVPLGRYGAILDELTKHAVAHRLTSDYGSPAGTPVDGEAPVIQLPLSFTKGRAEP